MNYYSYLLCFVLIYNFKLMWKSFLTREVRAIYKTKNYKQFII